MKIDSVDMVKTMKFEHGKSYPIETLPDDLNDQSIPNRDRWAIRSALFWNDCQGWWQERVAEYWLGCRYNDHMARFWSPLPPDPMTREEILAERGEVVCPVCDWAVSPSEPHLCRPSENLLRQRELQALADSAVKSRKGA